MSPKHTILNGVGIWVGIIVVSLALLPWETGSEPIHESLKAAAIAGLALAATVRQLARTPRPSAAQGLLVGVVWSAVVIGLDLALFATGAFTIGLWLYVVDVASSYLIVPVVTTIAFGLLRPRAAPGVASEAAPAAPVSRAAVPGGS